MKNIRSKQGKRVLRHRWGEQDMVQQWQLETYIHVEVNSELVNFAGNLE